MRRISALLIALLVSLPALADLIGETAKGTTDYSVELKIIDSTDGTVEEGVTSATGGLNFWYRREGEAITNFATESDLALLTTAHTDEGFLHIDDGVYRVDIADAAVASGADYVYVGGTATGMIVIGGRVKLTDVDMNDGVRAGMTALPNAAADAAGGLPISDAGALPLDDIPLTAEFEARTLLATSYFDPALDTVANVTDLTNLPSIPANWLTAAGITAGALNGKGDWNIGKTGYALTNEPANFSSLSIDGSGRIDVGAIAGTTQGATDIDARLDGIEGATFSTGTDSLEAIRDRGDAAWTTGSGTGLTAIASGTAQSATGTTLVLAAGETFDTNELVGAVVQITGGSTGVGQSRCISANGDATSDTITVPTWTTTPTGTITYEIAPSLGGECPLSTSSGATQLNVTASGNIGIDLANVENPTTTLALPNVTVGTVTTLNGHTAQTGDNYARLGAPAGASVSADVAAVKADTAATLVDTDALETRLTATRADNLDVLEAERTAFLNCEVNTLNFAGSTTTLACILTDIDGGAVTQATGDLEGWQLLVTSGDQIREGRHINDTTWDAANSELQLTLSRPLPATLADAVTAVIR